MKKSELKQLIREEIRRLTEAETYSVVQHTAQGSSNRLTRKVIKKGLSAEEAKKLLQKLEKQYDLEPLKSDPIDIANKNKRGNLQPNTARGLVDFEIVAESINESIVIRNGWIILNPRNNMSVRSSAASLLMSSLKEFDIWEVPANRRGGIPSWVLKKVEHQSSRVFGVPDLEGEKSDAFHAAFDRVSGKIRASQGSDIAIHFMHN